MIDQKNLKLKANDIFGDITDCNSMTGDIEWVLNWVYTVTSKKRWFLLLFGGSRVLVHQWSDWSSQSCACDETG